MKLISLVAVAAISTMLFSATLLEDVISDKEAALSRHS